MKTINVEEFFLAEVEEGQCADVECAWCEYRGAISFTDAFKILSTRYANPNRDIIIDTHKHLLRWISISFPEVKCINDVVKLLCCPACNDNSLHIPDDSEYNLKRILESLQCHIS